MPSLAEWEAALRVPRNVRVDSSAALATRINSRAGSASFRGQPKLAREIPNNPVPHSFQLTALDLLLQIGRMTAPRIANLSDLSSTWAIIRYIWAFEPDLHPSDLRLSSAASNIDFHQKAVLSDEVGVGMASLIVERYLHGSNPIDVSLALLDGTIVGLSQQYSTSPDYIFEVANNQYIVLESKGTQSGRDNAFKQLKRGTEQLVSLQFANGNNPLSLVISTSLSTEQCEVFVIDPPSKKDESESPKKIVIQDSDKLRVDIRGFAMARLALFAGAPSLAARIAPDSKYAGDLLKMFPSDARRDETLFTQIGEKYVGAQFSLPLIGETRNLQVFFGIALEQFEALPQKDWIRVDQIAQEKFSVASRIKPEFDYANNVSVNFIETGDELVASILHKDGSFMKVRVS